FRLSSLRCHIHLFFPYTTLFRSCKSFHYSDTPLICFKACHRRFKACHRRFLQILENQAKCTERAKGQQPAAQHAGTDLLPQPPRSEEHTSELQSRENLVCRLLLE